MGLPSDSDISAMKSMIADGMSHYSVGKRFGMHHEEVSAALRDASDRNNDIRIRRMEIESLAEVHLAVGCICPAPALLGSDQYCFRCGKCRM